MDFAHQTLITLCPHLFGFDVFLFPLRNVFFQDPNDGVNFFGRKEKDAVLFPFYSHHAKIYKGNGFKRFYFRPLETCVPAAFHNDDLVFSDRYKFHLIAHYEVEIEKNKAEGKKDERAEKILV